MNDSQGETIRNTRRLSFVPRWVVAPTLRTQNVAEHSYHVACICDVLLSHHKLRQSQSFTLEVLRHAMYHDADEAHTGDAPAPSKDNTRRMPSQLTPAGIVVKVADLIEACVFCSEECTMGNVSMAPIYQDALKRGKTYWDFFKWDEATGPRPDFEVVMSWFQRETALERHPVLEHTK